jgi:hypothetical protein
MEACPQAGAKRKSPSSSASSRGEASRKQPGPNGRTRKERQPNWSGPEVLALIAAKEEEHEAQKLTGDQRDLMHTASQKWAKIAEAEEVQRARISGKPCWPITRKFLITGGGLVAMRTTFAWPLSGGRSWGFLLIFVAPNIGTWKGL